MTSPVGVAQRRGVALQPGDDAVGAQEAELGRGRVAAGGGLVPAGDDAIAVVGMHGLEPALAARLLGRQAGHLAPVLVDEHVVAIGLGAEDADRRMAGERAEALFAFAKGHFAALAFGDVHRGAEHAHRLPSSRSTAALVNSQMTSPSGRTARNSSS